MTAQELNTYIDKVLGNSLRCLLPSYWWKRLLKLLIEYADTIRNEVAKKQDKNLYFIDKVANNWVSDETHVGCLYRCDILCKGVGKDDFAQVVFGYTESISGCYAQICETDTDVVKIWSAINKEITIPVIIITRQS